jgi:arsenical pump membrane protein
MFTIVDALSLSGVNAAVAGALANLPPIYGVGVASFLSCSLMNNIPMSVLFADLIPAVGGNYVANYYAAVIGSNLGALLTPLGALAGIMWMNMLDGKGCHISFARFTKCGLAISLISLLFALSGLQLSLLIFQ